MSLNPSLPASLSRRLLWLPDRSRNMGIHFASTKGTGKSRLLGRVIAWLDFVRGVPLVLLDPHGPSIDNFLDKLSRLPQEDQERLWPRVVYVDMAGSNGYVTPFPLYYRLGNESLYSISQRYLDVVRRLDPHLQTASIEGWNALWRIGTNAGMILSACGLQITEAEDLVRDPKRWAERIAQACARNAELQPAAEFFTQDFSRLNPNEQARRTDSFLNKTSLFRLDPTMKAMFGATTPGIDWQKVVDQSLVVLIDFRGEHDIERMRFKLLWVFHFFTEFVKRRGPGRHKPISLIIDEITYLLSSATLHADLLASDLEELVNRLARNYMVWLTLAHQEMYQFPESIQKTLLTMGTQIFGSTTDLDSALALSRRFFRFDPKRVRKTEPVYSSYQGVSEVIDYRTVEYTMEEQEYLESLRFLDLGRYRFLVSPSLSEGTVGSKLHRISTERIDEGLFVNEELVGKARDLLMRRRGKKVEELLPEIATRGVPQAPATSRITHTTSQTTRVRSLDSK